MAHTNSWAFPNMFDITHNSINIAEDNASIVNRTRLLILTEPTELYNSPTFGVGLKRYLWQYNTENTKAIIQDRIKSQLKLFEPCVDSDSTVFSDGLLYSETVQSPETYQQFNELNMTVGLQTTFSTNVDITLDNKEDL